MTSRAAASTPAIAPVELPATAADEQIVARVLAGEPQLFELIMRRYNRRLFRVARSIVRDDDQAEDVMQEAYVRAYENLAAFEGRAAFATWLTRIAVHAALARVRRAGRERPADVDDIEEPYAMPTPSDPERRAGDREIRGMLEASIDALPEHYRSVFVLRAVEELSVAETAACLGIEEETVKTRYFRARNLLQKALLERMDAAAPGAFEFHLARCDRVVAAVFAKIGVAGHARTRAS